MKSYILVYQVSIIIGIAIAIDIFVRTFFKKFSEGFGSTSPGTMVQLQTSHVTTEDDEYYYRYIYPKLVSREIYRMTESDLPLYPKV